MADGHDMGERAKFREMLEGTKEDWDIIVDHSKSFNKGLAKRVLDHLRLLDGDFGGFPIDRLEHSLQTATRAHRDGRDEEYVVCALLHDIGDTLGSYNHPDVAAAILKPFVSEANLWMVANHGAFQVASHIGYLRCAPVNLFQLIVQNQWPQDSHHLTVYSLISNAGRFIENGASLFAAINGHDHCVVRLDVVLVTDTQHIAMGAI